MNEPVEVWRLPAHEFAAGRRAPGWTVGPAGELAVLLVSEDGPAAWSRGPGRGLPYDAELVTVGPGGERRSGLSDVGVRPDHLALLPGGRTLVACAGLEGRRAAGSTTPSCTGPTAGRPGS